LLALHILFAVLFLGASAVAGVLHFGAMRRERPSDVAGLLRRVRLTVPFVGVGALGTLGVGLALVHRQGYSFSDGWIVAALVLWVAAVALGTPSGTMLRHTRELAERLAADGDRPSEELHRAVANPVALALNYASFACLLAILVLMILKP
jgi:uncharacterized membrane protein